MMAEHAGRQFGVRQALESRDFLRSGANDTKGLIPITESKTAEIINAVYDLRRKNHGAIHKIDVNDLKNQKFKGMFVMTKERTLKFNLGGLYGELDLDRGDGVVYAVKVKRLGIMQRYENVPLFEIL